MSEVSLMSSLKGGEGRVEKASGTLAKCKQNSKASLPTVNHPERAAGDKDFELVDGFLTMPGYSSLPSQISLYCRYTASLFSGVGVMLS